LVQVYAQLLTVFSTSGIGESSTFKRDESGQVKLELNRPASVTGSAFANRQRGL
jgi:hypothetical protein